MPHQGMSVTLTTTPAGTATQPRISTQGHASPVNMANDITSALGLNANDKNQRIRHLEDTWQILLCRSHFLEKENVLWAWTINQCLYIFLIHSTHTLTSLDNSAIKAGLIFWTQTINNHFPDLVFFSASVCSWSRETVLIQKDQPLNMECVWQDFFFGPSVHINTTSPRVRVTKKHSVTMTTAALFLISIAVFVTRHCLSHFSDVSSRVSKSEQLYFSWGIASTMSPAKSSGPAHCARGKRSWRLKLWRYIRSQSQTIGFPLMSTVCNNQAIFDQHGSTCVRPLWSNNSVCRPDQSLQSNAERIELTNLALSMMRQ